MKLVIDNFRNSNVLEKAMIVTTITVTIITIYVSTQNKEYKAQSAFDPPILIQHVDDKNEVELHDFRVDDIVKPLKKYSLDHTSPVIINKDVKQYEDYLEYKEYINKQKKEIENKIDLLNKGKVVSKINLLINTSKDYLGIPYVWGGENQNGMDCSAFVRDLYSKVGYYLPRVSKDQSKVGELVTRDSLRPGDLLYFDTRNPRNLKDIKTPTEEIEFAQGAVKGFKPNTVSHVGMYIGNGEMIHASSGNGKIVEVSIDTDYYKHRFLWARRIIK